MRGLRQVLGLWARAFLAGVARGYRGRGLARTKVQLRRVVFEIDGAGTFRLLPERMLRGDTRRLFIPSEKAFMLLTFEEWQRSGMGA